MARSGWWRRGVALAVLLLMGCAGSHRPYANDPLLRERRAIWGDPGRARNFLITHAEPTPPEAPPPAEIPADGWVVAGMESGI